MKAPYDQASKDGEAYIRGATLMAQTGITVVDHEDTLVYMDGRYIPWSDAKIHVSTHAFLYGTAVFEGVRAYWSEKDGQLYVWCLKEHADRLDRNARMMGFDKAP